MRGLLDLKLAGQ